MQINGDLIIENSNVTLNRLVPYVLFESSEGAFLPIQMNDYKNNYYYIDVVGVFTIVIDGQYVLSGTKTDRIYIDAVCEQEIEISGNSNCSGLNTFACWGVRARIYNNILSERDGFSCAAILFGRYDNEKHVWIFGGDASLNYKVLKVIGYK